MHRIEAAVLTEQFTDLGNAVAVSIKNGNLHSGSDPSQKIVKLIDTLIDNQQLARHPHATLH